MKHDPVITKPCNWSGVHWISLPETNKPKSNYLYARKEFTLDQAPGSATLFLSAHRFYRVYVNGHYVGEGPPRNTVVKCSYRSYEVGGLLVKGSNAMAVEVYCPEVAKELRACICRLDLRDRDGNATQSIVSDTAWKVFPGLARDPQAQAESLWHAASYEFSEHIETEIFDARPEPDGWKRAGFDDSSWLTPLLDEPQFSFRSLPADYRPLSILEPSIIPEPLRQTVFPQCIVQAGEVVELDRSIQKDIGLKMGAF